MARRVKLILQAAAVLVVVLLVALLGWKVTQQAEGRGLDDALERGDRPLVPALTLETLDREGEISLADYRGQAARPQLLGLLVRALQGRGAAPRGDLAAPPRRGPRRDRHRRPGLPHRCRALRRALRADVSDRVRRPRAPASGASATPASPRRGSSGGTGGWSASTSSARSTGSSSRRTCEPRWTRRSDEARARRRRSARRSWPPRAGERRTRPRRCPSSRSATSARPATRPSSSRMLPWPTACARSSASGSLPGTP